VDIRGLILVGAALAALGLGLRRFRGRSADDAVSGSVLSHLEVTPPTRSVLRWSSAPIRGRRGARPAPVRPAGQRPEQPPRPVPGGEHVIAPSGSPPPIEEESLRRPWSDVTPSARRKLAVREPGVAALGALAIYLVGGYLLAFRYNSINGDALSRVANAGYVLFSRDPHLAAIGFVWNPMPSFLELPVLLLRPWCPWLLTRGFAGNVMSAATGSLAVWALAGILVDEEVRPILRWPLVAAFALHPIVLYAGANGMSEAPYLCFLLLGTRYLLRWIRNGSTQPLMIAGVALALGYYTRYEVIVAGVSAIGLVLVWSAWHTSGSWSTRTWEGVTDAVVIGAPIAFAFGTWSLASWIIVGSPFAQFTSQYGNSAQIALGAGGTPGGPHARMHYVIHQLLLLEPAIVAVVAVALLVALLRRDPAVLVHGAIFGSILVFEIAAFFKGQTASWLRYYIVEVPLLVLMLSTILGRRVGPLVDHKRRTRLSSLLVVSSRAGIAALALGAGAVGLLSGSTMVNSPSLAREETNQLQAIFYKSSPRADVLRRLRTERQAALYIESLHLPHGAVLMDVARAFTIWTQSNSFKEYLITPDRDFLAAVQDPVAYHVQYLLVEPNGALGSTDELNVEYPSLYLTGAGIATLVKEFDSTSDLGNWRLYRVNASSGTTTP
jgi:hypothetical protein